MLSYRWQIAIGIGMLSIIVALVGKTQKQSRIPEAPESVLLEDRTVLTAAQKQLPLPPPPPSNDARGFSAFQVTGNKDFERIVNVARDSIKDKDWPQAVEALQVILNDPKDYYVRVADPDPADPKKKIARWVRAKFESNNLIGTMPAEGKKAYEEKFGPRAKEEFDKGRKKNDLALIAKVAQQYRYSKAGAEAHEIILKKFRATLVPSALTGKDWPSWRGNATNTAQANAGTPLLDKKLWSRPIFMDKTEGFNDADPDDRAFKSVNAAIKQANGLKQPVMPGFFPIAARNIAVYRTHLDIRAVAVNEYMLTDEDGKKMLVKRGEILWKVLQYDRSFTLLLERKTRAKTESWIAAYEQVPGYSSFLFENSLLGAVATDGRLVYTINDLAVPPLPFVFEPRAWQQPQFNPQELRPLMMSNELHAYELLSGKRSWDITAEVAHFKDSHFIGMPISVGGNLYVLNEKMLNVGVDPVNPGGASPYGTAESELRLICIDPAKVNADGKPYIESVLPLGTIKGQDRFVESPRRRVNTAQPAYDDGVLVCPTNAGEVIGVDLLMRSMSWSYPYRDMVAEPIVLPDARMPGGAPAKPFAKWKASPPAIQAGKVVFTAPDADSVHCIQLRDGKPLWKKAQEKGDLYLAGVFEGRVLIVGERNIRALDLKDGSQLWTLALGEFPTGQGVASKTAYYLPIKTGILAVDLRKGEISARYPVPSGASSPGNLVFYENMLLSQTPTEMTVYSCK